MALSPGDRIGPYEILAPLGAGGMGEVYRARDSKLNRDVAIKVLPAALAHDADYLARFQREAQALAALHHPHIATIFGLEQDAIVMELVEGTPLRGPVPLEEALRLGRQIAEGLEAAHDKGIVHRDLKPGNILVTADGTVKILDFGLAKAVERTQESGSNSPTLTMRSTEAGLILGTAGYMSPEQAAGKPVDRRSDIWSFGVVLHELLTGKRLFDGETVSHTLADVLKGEIDLSDIPAGPVRNLVRRCLERNVKSRLQHIGEARIAMENYAPSDPVTTGSNWRWMAACAVCLVAAIGGWGAWFRKAAPPTPPAAFEVNPPAGTDARGVAISPDGKTLAFVAVDGRGERVLYLRPIDSLTAKAVPGTERGERPFWSPDSKSLGLALGSRLIRVDVAGGAPVTLAEIDEFRGGTWNPEGQILYVDGSSQMWRVAAMGGTPVSVMRSPNPTANPQFLPGGKRYLYFQRDSDEAKQGFWVGSFDGKPPVFLARGISRAMYDSASGMMLYTEASQALMARRLNLDSLELEGDPVTVAERVRMDNASWMAEYSASGNGSLCFVPARASEKRRFAWLDRTGRVIETVGQPSAVIGSFDVSWDEKRLVYTTDPRDQPAVWVLDLAGGSTLRLTVNDFGISPRFSSDGRSVFYTRVRDIRRRAADGSGEAQTVGTGTFGTGVSRDGKFLLVRASDIEVLPLTGQPKKQPYVVTQFGETGATFSPDGRWVAYQSNESGRNEIYVQGFPEKRGKWLVSSGGGTAPAWRSDGKELYWTGLDGMLMAASVEFQADSVRAGKAEPLFEVPARGEFRRFRPSKDGRKFLTLEPLEAGKVARDAMVVNLNWAAKMGR